MNINEIFVSYQGEGPYSGVKSLFIRLQGCNKKCFWCDSPSSLNNSINIQMTVDELVKEIPWNDVNNIVITGGEPLVQINQVRELVDKIPASYSIEIETNGSLPPTLLLESPVYFNISPKLDHSGSKFTSKDIEKLEEYENAVYFPIYKFVIDLNEADPLAQVFQFNEAGFPSERIWLMPLGVEKDILIENTAKLMQMDHPFNVSPRNHIIYGVK